MSKGKKDMRKRFRKNNNCKTASQAGRLQRKQYSKALKSVDRQRRNARF